MIVCLVILNQKCLRTVSFRYHQLWGFADFKSTSFKLHFNHSWILIWMKCFAEPKSQFWKKKMFQNVHSVMTEMKLEVDINTFCYQHSSMLPHSSSNSEEIRSRIYVNQTLFLIHSNVYQDAMIRWQTGKFIILFFIPKHSSSHRNYCTNNQ